MSFMDYTLPENCLKDVCNRFVSGAFCRRPQNLLDHDDTERNMSDTNVKKKQLRFVNSNVIDKIIRPRYTKSGFFVSRNPCLF